MPVSGNNAVERTKVTAIGKSSGGAREADDEETDRRHTTIFCFLRI